MTTVAYDGKTLCSDSLAVTGTRARLSNFKKIFLPQSDEKWQIAGMPIKAIGFAGKVDSFERMLPRLREGINLLDKPPAELQTCQLLCVIGDGVSITWSHYEVEGGPAMVDFVANNMPVGIGSGVIYAEGVLAIGGSAEQAVRASCKLDVNSGGDHIQHWSEDNPEVVDLLPFSKEAAHAKALSDLSTALSNEEDLSPDDRLDKIKTILKRTGV